MKQTIRDKCVPVKRGTSPGAGGRNGGGVVAVDLKRRIAKLSRQYGRPTAADVLTAWMRTATLCAVAVLVLGVSGCNGASFPATVLP